MSDRPLRTRREFLGKGLTLLGLGATVPLFIDELAWCLEDPLDVPLLTSRPGMPDHRVLVVIHLAGGNDGLNTVVPFRADEYYKSRPRIAIRPQDVLRLRGDLGLHPEARDLKALYDEGDLSVVLGVGYPNPNRSHFVSQEIWETASLDGKTTSGWIGRALDHDCTKDDPAPADLAVALSREPPQSFQGEIFQGLAVSELQGLRFFAEGDPDLARAFVRLHEGRVERPGDSTHLSYLTRVGLDARVAADKMQKALERRVTAEFPRSSFGQDLATVSRLIGAGLRTRVYSLTLGGFDTHSGQVGRHGRLMRELGQGLRAFVTDLRQQGQLDRVLVMAFTEFGRRVQENASQGTDHGEASPLFLAGGKIRPGLHGQPPDLRYLRRGDLVYTTDFREVYASVLKDWMGVEPASVLGRAVRPLRLIQA
jgi:uncharacterized protein (DUF1501 family)